MRRDVPSLLASPFNYVLCRSDPEYVTVQMPFLDLFSDLNGNLSVYYN